MVVVAFRTAYQDVRFAFCVVLRSREVLSFSAQRQQALHHFNLKVVFDPKRNGLEETVNFPIDVGTVIAGRYRIVEYLGSGVFSRAVQCFDMRMGGMVCIWSLRNNDSP